MLSEDDADERRFTTCFGGVAEPTCHRGLAGTMVFGCIGTPLLGFVLEDASRRGLRATETGLTAGNEAGRSRSSYARPNAGHARPPIFRFPTFPLPRAEASAIPYEPGRGRRHVGGWN